VSGRRKGEIAEFIPQLVKTSDLELGFLEQDATCIGQVDPFRMPTKQNRPEIRFQELQLAADCGLRDAQPSGFCREQQRRSISIAPGSCCPKPRLGSMCAITPLTSAVPDSSCANRNI
jgi:hypothetical protein